MTTDNNTVTEEPTTTIKKRLVNIIRRKGQEGKVSSIQGYRLLHSIITSHLFHIFTDEEDSKRIDSYFGFSTDIHSGREAFKKLFYNLKALMSNENTRKISFN